jgi:hypothetical protein
MTTSDKRREEKYQAIKLYNSNVITLSDIKALFRVTATVTDDEYSSKTDQKDVLGAKARIDRIAKLAQTRQAAQAEAILRFRAKPRLTENRAEVIAKFATGYRGQLPHNWKRYGTLIKRTKRVNPPRHGSSKGKIGRTTYVGFKKFNKDWDNFERALQGLLQKDKSSRTIKGAIDQVKRSVSITARRGR